ncbi:MAG: NAD(P)-dependent oxidoreductase [Calditrichaeota bacterium]|nr:NAD(P)-dependent oxidoreductase [Calditrichota bacterium]
MTTLKRTPTLLVTGFGGFVAGSIIAQGMNDYKIHTVDRIDVPKEQGDVNYHQLDLTDSTGLARLFVQIDPDAVIHTAAIADIDFCQKNQQIAKKVNVGVTQQLAELCGKSGAKLVFCSTDTVFDGKKGFYVEDDPPHPINFYAETKVRGEQIISETVRNAAIARLSLVMGLSVMGTGNSFLARTIEKLQAGDNVKFPENEIRTPVDVITLGRALLELADNAFHGTIHLAGNDRLTRYDMARRIAERLGYSPDLIIATNSNAMPGRAPRPDDASLNNSKAKSILKTPMQNLIEGLDLTLNYKSGKSLHTSEGIANFKNRNHSRK